MVIAHATGYAAIVLFLEVIAYSRKLCYAFLLYCGVPVNQVESPSVLMGVESAWFV